MTQFVADASVAIKWVLPEIHSDVALLLLSDDCTLLVPDFSFLKLGIFCGSVFGAVKLP